MDTISKQQMAVMVARFVEFQEKFSPMSKADAQFVIQDTAAAIDLIVKAIAKRNAIVGLCKNLNAVELPATTDVFNAQTYFWCNPERPVKMSDFSIHFFEWFYAKTEGIKVRRLLNKSRLLTLLLSSGPIIADIGGEESAETFMVDIVYLVEQQPNGEKGHLDTNGNANIFFVRNSANHLKEVSVSWAGKSWLFQAHSLDSGHAREDGSIIFSY